MTAEARGAAKRQTAFTLFAGGAYDPTAAAGRLAWQRPTGVALLQRNGGNAAVPGSHPALGGGRIAWLDDGATVVADPATFRDRDRFSSPGAGVIALSETVLAWRARDPAGTDRLWAVPLGGGEARLLLESPAPTEIGRPALLGGLVLCHVAGPGGSRILAIDAATRRPAAPAHRADRHAHEPVDRRRAAALRAGHRAPAGAAPGPGRAGRARSTTARCWSSRRPAGATSSTSTGATGTARATAAAARRCRRARAPGVVATLWSTALTGDAAYVTRLRAVSGGARTADILRVPALP